MIVTDKFVFVHLPRSGGTFVSEVIRKFFPSAHEIGYHFHELFCPRELSAPCSWCGSEPLGILRLMVSSRVAQDCRHSILVSLGDRERLGFVGTTTP